MRIELFTELAYSVELLIGYSVTQLEPEIAINHRAGQNKGIPGSSLKFVIQHWFEMSQNNGRNASHIFIKYGCS